MRERYSIAHVSPYPWGTRHEVNLFIRGLANELSQRGHRVLVLAPSDSRRLIHDSRALIRQAADNPDALFGEPGSWQLLAVGQSLPFPPPRRSSAVSLPIDVSRTIEQVLETVHLDLVHVHEPFAPSAASVALRHSRALNIGTFHQPTERVLSTQLARRVVELVFGRLDARTTSFHVTRNLISRFFPGEYEVINPGAQANDQLTDERGATAKPLRILFAVEEERAALRLFIRALRSLDMDRPWRAIVWSNQPAERPLRLSRRLRERVSVRDSSHGPLTDQLAEADVLCACSQGVAPVPQLLLKTLAFGVVPVTSRLPIYEEVLNEGEDGLLFDGRDHTVLAAQLERLISSPALRRSLQERAIDRRPKLSWRYAADQFEQLYRSVAARRHQVNGIPSIRRRLTKRDLIWCDLHMHTDHSPDCATPVDVLLKTAKRRGLGAIAITDHNEISGALEARERADGIKVIVGEEVKTAHEGEVIGLFLEEKIPRGMSLAETITAIRDQNGLVYIPHPFDRFHSVPDYEHLLKVIPEIDIIEVFNPRVTFTAFNEEAERFAAKYRVVAGAGSDSHVVQGLGSVKIHLRDFYSPQEFLESLRDADIVRQPKSLLYVQALKFLQTTGRPAPARRAAQAKAANRAKTGKRRRSRRARKS